MAANRPISAERTLKLEANVVVSEYTVFRYRVFA